MFGESDFKIAYEFKYLGDFDKIVRLCIVSENCEKQNFYGVLDLNIKPLLLTVVITEKA